MNKFMKTSWLVIIATCFVTSAFANATQLWVTKNFNEDVLIEEDVVLTDASVMDILRAKAEVMTAFSGRFVTHINDVPDKSEKGLEYWIYYINGKMAHVGATSYIPAPGDVVWWDIHEHNDSVYVSSVIGAFPKPFDGGYDGIIPATSIISTKGLNGKAEELKETLLAHDIEEVTVEPFHKSLDSKSANARIVIGHWNDIKQSSFIQDLVRNYRKTGFFVKFNEEGFNALNLTGQEVSHFKEGAAILAIGSGFLKEPAFWVVTGTSNEEVAKAVDILVNEPERIQYFSGAVLTNGELINVPLAKNK